MKPRDFFSNQIKHSLLGPGSDVYAVEDINQEVIGSYPLQRYYTAILFPEKRVVSPDEEAPEEGNADAPIEEEESDAEGRNVVDEIKEKPKTVDPEYVAANQYFPTNCGMTVLIDKDVTSLEVEIAAANYKEATYSDIKVHISENDYSLLVDNLPPRLKSLITFENGVLSLTKAPKGTTKGGGTEDYKAIRELSNNEALKYSQALRQLNNLFMPAGRVWKRVPFTKKVSIDLYEGNGHQVVIDQSPIQLRIFSKIINAAQGKFVKLLLHNNSEEHPSNKFSNANEKLNAKCLFQIKMAVSNPHILPYRQASFINQFDEEANSIEYQYRKEQSYGIGHGTGLHTFRQKGIITVSTTFMPEIDVPMVSNKLADNPFFEQIAKEDQVVIEQTLNIKSLSSWSDMEQSQVLIGLRAFINAYADWISEQKRQAESHKKLSEKFIQQQEATHNRLQKSIDLLENNPVVWDCFRYANTAMYIQLVISIDERFGKAPKELKEVEYGEAYYNSLRFFQEYTPKAPLQYRPFQLAFLLLNLEGIIAPNNRSERELVDLLWFPTGGGKTEAYLAVTAFTILWRRLENPNSYQGVSVIMRYTLRLLTAQQFERASRLICALEFLRSQQPKRFGDDRMTIGMWVGNATTPNKLKGEGGASEVYDNIATEINKLNQEKNGKPEDKNRFQLESCPWCGCKTISQHPKNSKYLQAFNTRGEAACLNDSCHFSELENQPLPIYVVDEALYQNPPTLLFATVDKFAMLAHKKEGHKFFNSLDDKLLPPDLIIQDELHLLNGPLGSIVGLYERVIEALCTKNNTKPKIIASTATTRNTDHQINGLYQRKVAIFPPPGIYHDDNFFAYNLKNSRRKYIGFMPTGKTSTDTQLKLLANLLFARTNVLQSLRQQYPDAEDRVWKELDPYYTIVSYYNSLKDVGKTYNKVNAEVYDEFKLLLERHHKNHFAYNFLCHGLISRTEELTSRIPSHKIKPVLKKLETELQIKPRNNQKGFYVDEGVDLVLASNMISVGIDVGRLNLMLINGQPRNVAEYIQASSRVARSYEGLVFNLLDPNRSREKSYFEHYEDFHKAYYKFVEPLSLTPNTSITFNKALNSLLVCYVRHKLGKQQAHEFKREDTQGLLDIIKTSLHSSALCQFLEELLEKLANNWIEQISQAEENDKQLRYNKIPRDQPYLIGEGQWDLMMSMREIDKQSVIEIK